MKLKAVLTYGWHNEPGIPYATDWDAAALKEEEGEGYDATLARIAAEQSSVQGVDKLFRRRGEAGVDPIKRFVHALLHSNEETTLTCHIDYFAYVFLKGAKNFDFFFPALKEESEEQMEALFGKEGISTLLERLQNFELTGVGELDGDTKRTYLEARPLAQRASARDEWRSLAVLLFSGPSSLDSISKDLGLGYTLSDRLLVPFRDCGLLNKEGNGYCLETVPSKMAVTLAMLRAVLGLNPLEEEANLWKLS